MPRVFYGVYEGEKPEFKWSLVQKEMKTASDREGYWSFPIFSSRSEAEKYALMGGSIEKVVELLVY